MASPTMSVHVQDLLVLGTVDHFGIDASTGRDGLRTDHGATAQPQRAHDEQGISTANDGDDERSDATEHNNQDIRLSC